MNQLKKLIKNGLIVPNASGQPEAFWGWILINGNKIQTVEQGNPPSDMVCDQVIDAKDHAVIPGMANSHAHSHSSISRGSAEGLPLHLWLPIIEKEQRLLTEEQAYIAAKATFCEAVLNGTTLILDMSLFPHAAIQAAREVGLRIVVAPYTAASKSFTPSLDVTESLLQIIPHSEEMVKVWVGLHDIETCGDDQLSAGLDLALQYNTGIHLHCSETRVSTEETMKRTGSSPVAHLANLGLLKNKTLLAHCVWVNDADITLMAENGTNVAHCPHANLKLGSGIAPIPKLVNESICITLGTDGAKANNRLDMFDVMKFASLIHKGIHFEPNIISPKNILNMATKNGYNTFDLFGGSIAPGYLADIVMLNLNRFHMQPASPETILTNIVHSARGSDVELVMVDGKIILENGELVSIDQMKVLADLKKLSKKFIV